MDNKCDSINDYPMKCDLPANHLECHEHVATESDEGCFSEQFKKNDICKGHIFKWRDLYVAFYGPSPNSESPWFLTKEDAQRYADLHPRQQQWSIKARPLDPKMWQKQAEIILWHRVGVHLLKQTAQELEIFSWLRQAVAKMTDHEGADDLFVVNSLINERERQEAL